LASATPGAAIAAANAMSAENSMRLFIVLPPCRV
jgi:hypothetical protein